MSAEAATAVIQEYVDACKAASVERLKGVFHPNALMSGYMQGEFLMGSPDPFFQIVETSSPCEYDYEISQVDVNGDVASVRLDEEGYLGMNFTDYFHVANVDGKWQIISKTFHVR